MSSLVKLEWQDASIAFIQMQDVNTNNTLSPALINDLQAAFNEVNNNPKAKAVILTGLDSCFCCGNVKLSKAQNNPSLHKLLLSCEVPIIAAVQGDALGDGLVLAAYTDIIILAEESNYSAYYLNESCTPGVGVSYIIPKKLGRMLGAEFLYTAQNFTGQALKARNTSLRIVPKDKVIATALELSKDFNEKLEVSIRLLKKNFNEVTKSEIAQYLEQEIASA